jgi:hypothetical protein
MPIKFMASAKEVDRKTKRVTTVHHYIKSMSNKELFNYVNEERAVPKRRAKCLNELARRGIEINWVNKNDV